MEKGRESSVERFGGECERRRGLKRMSWGEVGVSWGSGLRIVFIYKWEKFI